MEASIINSDSLSSSDSGFIDNSNQSGAVGSVDSSKAASSCSDMEEPENEFDPSGIVTKAMVQEEEKLKLQADKQLEKMRKKYQNDQHSKEMEEKKVQRLKGLLERSQFYSNFAANKLNQLKDISSLKSKQTGKKQESERRKKNKRTANDENAPSPKALKIEQSDSNVQRVLVDRNSENTATKEKQVGKPAEETRVSSLGITVPASQPKLLVGAALRDYQMQGLDWLKTLFLGGMNGILADEMGLGKTIQIISLVCHLYEEGVGGPFLIVAPLSTLPNWIHEFETFAPDVPVVLFHGDQNARKQLQKSVHKKHSLLGDAVRPVIITSFEIPLRENVFLGSIRWKYIIVDEGHRLKNHNTLLARTLSDFKTINRMLLTGTPLQNNLYELWSLLHFLMPEVFDDLDDFQAWFSEEELQALESKNSHLDILEKEVSNNFISTLHKILEPFLLRRVKADVNLNLPPKEEKHIFCPLTEVQYELYSQTVDRTIVHLDGKHKPEDLIIPDNEDGTRAKRECRSRFNIKKLLDESNTDFEDVIQRYKEPETDQTNNQEVYEYDSEFYKMRLTMQSVHKMLIKIANHPYLVRRLVIPGTNILLIDDRLISSSGKMMVLDSLLARLKKDNHKVLIFSTYTMILDLLEDFMEMREHSYVRLDGSTKIEDRRERIKRFNTEPELFAFLISTRAGGLGINLVAADTVIIFDSDWNPQVDLQAQDRCHRIGQTKPVVVFRLISSGTVDERIVTRADAKRKLEKLIIKAGGFKHSSQEKGGLKASVESLKELLNEKNHSVEIHPNGSVLTDNEWKELLDRSF